MSNNQDIKMYDKPSTEGLVEFTQDDINRLLSTMPRTIYEYGLAVKEKMDLVDKAKLDVKRAMAKQHLVARTRDELTSEADRKAWAQVQPEVTEAEDELLIAIGALKGAELRVDYCENLFVSVRKSANIVLAEREAENRANRFEPPEKQ